MFWILFLCWGLLLGTTYSQSNQSFVPFYAGNLYNLTFSYATAASSVNAFVNTSSTGATLSFTITALNETFENNTVTLEMNFSSIVCVPDPDDMSACEEYRNLTSESVAQMTQNVSHPYNYVNCYFPDVENNYHRGCVLFSRLLNLYPYPDPDTLSEIEIPHDLEIAGMKPNRAWKSTGIHHKSLRPVYRTHYWFDNEKSFKDVPSDIAHTSCQVIVSTLNDDSETDPDDAREKLKNSQTICYTTFGPVATSSMDEGTLKNSTDISSPIPASLSDFVSQKSPSSTTINSHSYLIDMENRLHKMTLSVSGFQTHLVPDLPAVHDIAFSSISGRPLTFLVDDRGHIHIFVNSNSPDDLSNGYSMNQHFNALFFETVPVDGSVPYGLIGVAIDTVGSLHALTQNSTGLFWIPIILERDDSLEASSPTFVSVLLLPPSFPSFTQMQRNIGIGFALTRTGALYLLRPPDNTEDCYDSLDVDSDQFSHLCWSASSYPPTVVRPMMLWNVFAPMVQDSLVFKSVAQNYVYGIADEGKLLFSNTLQQSWNEIALSVKSALSLVRQTRRAVIHEVLYLDKGGTLNCLSFREGINPDDGKLVPEFRINRTISVEQGSRLFLIAIENISHVLMTNQDETSALMFRQRDENQECSWVKDNQPAKLLFSLPIPESAQSDEDDSTSSQYYHNVSTSLQSKIQVIGTNTNNSNLPLMDNEGFNVISYDETVLIRQDFHVDADVNETLQNLCQTGGSLTANNTAYRNVINNLDGRLLQDVIPWYANALESNASCLYSDNFTSAMLGPLTSHLPPLDLADELSILIMNSSLPVTIRRTAAAQSWSIVCPTDELVSFLTNIVSTNGSDLFAEANLALSLYATWNCSGQSVAEYFGHPASHVKKMKLMAESQYDGDSFYAQMTHVRNPSRSYHDFHLSVDRHTSKMNSPETDSLAASSIAALGNTRRKENIPRLIEILKDHPSETLRSVSARSLRHYVDKDVVEALTYSISNDPDHSVRNSALLSLMALDESLSKSRRNPLSHVLATSCAAIVNSLRHATHEWIEMNNLKCYFERRMKQKQEDLHFAHIGLQVIQHISNSVNSSLLSASPLSFSRTFPNRGSQAWISLSASTHLPSVDENGFYADALGSVDAGLFGYSLSLVKAGIITAWTSTGLIQGTAYFVVTLIDIKSGKFFDYDVVFQRVFYQSPVGISKGNVCDLNPPEDPIYVSRIQKDIFTLSYYYGIPHIADADIQVHLVGWMQASYGILVVVGDGNITQNMNITIKGYVVPAAGIDGETSANVQVLVAKGGIQGTLRFASLSLPLVAAYYGGRRSLGTNLSPSASFLKGNLDLYYEVWSPSWKCWACTKRKTKNILKWNGIQFSQTMLKSPLCSSSSTIQSNLMSNLHQLVSPPILPMQRKCCTCPNDNEQVQLQGCRDIACVLCEEPNEDDPCLIPYALSSYPNSAFTYQCDEYPDICANTLCYYKAYKGTMTQIVTRSSDTTTNRKLSLSGLPCARGFDRDEVPMASWDSGGCYARIQLADPTQNRRHGGQMGGFYRAKKIKAGTSFQIHVDCTTVPDCLKKVSATACLESDYRYQNQETSWCVDACEGTRLGPLETYGISEKKRKSPTGVCAQKQKKKPKTAWLIS